MIYFLSFLWFLRQTKAVLFWLYLWQLKEYHIGRFVDHFRTEKGKKLLLNGLLILKIILALSFLALIFITDTIARYSRFFNLFISSLFILYFLELIKFFQDSVSRKVKKPVLTKKTIFLIFAVCAFEVFYFLSLFQDRTLFFFWLLTFDILTPLIVSGIVLLFQPLAVLLKNQIIEKAKRKRQRFKNLLVIGITGSYGKTSTKEFLAAILSEKYRVLKTREHQNSEIGISYCILNELNENHEIFIAEMGAYNRGGIRLLCDMTKPKIGILTGINEQHMATFGSLENIIKAKYELIESLPENGTAIFNGNNKIIHGLRTEIKNYNQKIKDIRFCSSKGKMDVWAEDIKTEKEYLVFKVFSKDGDSASFKVNLLGAQNVENILLAACCAKELGMTLEEISSACKKIKQEQGGMKILKGVKGLNIIDSTYSSNPTGVISHLEYLKSWKAKKIIVMPCLIELGKASREIHQRIGRKISEVCGLAIITTKDRFKDLKEGIVSSGQKKERILFIENPEEIVKTIEVFSGKDDIVLLEGRVSKETLDRLSLSTEE